MKDIILEIPRIKERILLLILDNLLVIIAEVTFGFENDQMRRASTSE